MIGVPASEAGRLRANGLSYVRPGGRRSWWVHQVSLCREFLFVQAENPQGWNREVRVSFSAPNLAFNLTGAQTQKVRDQILLA